MDRSRMMALGVGLAMAVGVRSATAQAVFVDVGIAAPSVGARIVWGSPPPVVVYRPAPAYYYPAPVGIVYYETLPTEYWDYIRVYEPYRYARFRSWLDYERSYQRAWRAHDRIGYDQLRSREDAYFRERAVADRGFRDWTRSRDDDRGHGNGRGHDRGNGRGRRW